ncbi:hypothetical protein [Nocardia sp. XZ_19_385]|uniref:hypothetical protein n=1 Tax=Nocardia sp. XZ_19_385 TaxID=2769488 RepID=UPI00188E32A5|nr:hypothetical protein [Nocardia sp. XZ_19_385]
MVWWAALAFGAAGGLVVQLIAFWTDLSAWQEDRRNARRAHQKSRPWADYFDPGPDLAVAATRLALGGAAGLIFHDHVTSSMAAIAVGASAPALLRQLGTSRTLAEVPRAQDPGTTAESAVVEP